MNAAYIIVGLIFLFNPNVNVIDILPDFIGYALIMKGISRIQSVNLSMTEAYESFRALMIVEMIKIPASFIYGLINVSGLIMVSPSTGDIPGSVTDAAGSYTDYTSILIVSIIFAIVEIILSLKAFRAFFEGIEALSVRVGESAADISFSAVRRFTLVYAVIKPVMYVLPELSSLSTGNYGTVTESGILNLSKYRGLFIIISFAICLFIGAMWLSRAIVYFRGIKKDKRYLDALEERARETELERADTLLARKRSFALLILAAAVFFMLELRVDGADILPPFVAAGLFAVACELMMRCGLAWGKRLLRVLYSLNIAVSVLFYAFQCYISDKYKSDNFGLGEMIAWDIEASFEALDRFIWFAVVSAVNSCLLVAVCIAVFVFLKRGIKEYAFIPTKGGNILDSDIRDATAKSKRLNIGLYLSLVFGVASALSSAIATALLPYFSMWWMIDFVIRGLYIGLSLYTVVSLRDEVKLHDQRLKYADSI